MKGSLAVVFVCSLLIGLPAQSQAQALTNGPLVVSSTNPRYFADASGRPIYLTGVHNWANNKDGWGIPNDCGAIPAFDWDGYLNFLQSYGYNRIRLWTWELPKSISEPYPSFAECHEPLPFLRTGPGLATDGQPKFDLSQFDQTYFDRLRQRIIDAGNHGMYVTVMLFEGAGLQYNRRPDDGYWFTKANNINGIDDGYTTGSYGRNSQTLTIPAITNVQDNYVRKVIDTVNDLNNVLYEIANSPGSPYSTNWELHMINLVHSYEATKLYQHPVGFTCQYPSGVDSNYFSSSADYVTPCASGYGYPVSETSTGNKVVIADTDDEWYWKQIIWATQTDPVAMRKWAWENFTRGANTAFMDPYLTTWPVRNSPSGNNVDPYWNVMRIALSQTASYAKRLDLAQATPQNSLCSTTFCLVSPGFQYLVYDPAGGPFTVSMASGSYSYEWFSAGTNTIAAMGTVAATAGLNTFTPPFAGDAVFFLQAGATPPPPPPPSPPSNIAFVQVSVGNPHPSAASISIPFVNTQTAGNLNIVVIGWNDATSSVQSVKDSNGNTYKLASSLLRIGSGTGGSALSQAIYYAANVMAGSDTVTITFNQAATHPDIRILEYTGVGALDVTAGATGNSATSNSGSASTTTANELLFAANTVYTLTTGPGSGFTTRVITWPNGDIAEDRVVSTTGSYSTTAPLSAAGTWIMQMATFKAAGMSTAPTVSAVSPSSGPTTGGTAVTITGTNFVSGATVTFGGTAATHIQVVNATSITATTPAHSAGAVNVVVTNPDSQTGTLSNGYNYVSSTGIGFVQLNYAVPQTSSSAIVISYPAAQMAGDLNIVVVGWNDTTSSIQSVTDSAGNSYALAGTLLRVGSGTAAPLSQAIFYAAGIAGGGNTVTVTFTQAANHPDVRVLEYSGVTTLDAAGGATGHSTTSSSGPISTTTANELVFGANTVFTLTSGPGSGFTSRVITFPNGDIAEDRIVNLTGSYSATAPLTQSGNWVMQIATFK